MFEIIRKWLRTGVTAVLVCCLCLNTCACSRKHTGSETLEKEADNIMTALKELDLKIFNDRTDNYVTTYRNWIGIPKEKEYRIFSELLQPGYIRARIFKENQKRAEKLMENLTWNIIKVREDGTSARVDMEIRNKDISNAMGMYTVHIMESMIDSVGGEGKENKQNGINYKDKYSFLSCIDQEKGTYTADITLEAYQDDGVWKLHLSDEFVNAVLGNMDSEEYSDEIEERLDELEDEYEQEIEKWGDRYEQEMEDWGDGYERGIEKRYDEYAESVEHWVERLFE